MITLQNSFQHFETQSQSRLLFKQSNQREPSHLEEMPNEQQRSQIITRGGLEALIEMNARPIKIKDAPRPAPFSPGPIVLYAISEINANAMAFFSQPQTEVNFGLALPIPTIESANRVKRFHINQRAAGMGCFHLDDALAGQRFGLALKFFP